MLRLTTLALVGILGTVGAGPLQADDAVRTNVGDLYRDKTSLAGKQVSVQGQVVKVNNRVMKRNFIHIQDGSGDAAQGTNDLTVTTQDTVAVGDQVNVSGTVTLDRDFGYGYRYPLLVEEASVTRSE